MSTIAKPIPSSREGRQRPRWASNLFWYGVLLLASLATVLPFMWLLMTALKGPGDAVFSLPPQFIPREPTLANFGRVWDQLPIWRFFLNSLFVATLTVALNVLVSSLAAYPLAKMEFPGRELIFYALLATLIVPAELTYIPGYILAVNVFKYYDTLWSLIFPSVFSAFNIFLLRQAYKSVPNDLIDAARIDGASELRIWWGVLMPTIRPAVATAAVFTAVTSWNALLWPSLMLRNRELYTLPVGLLALRGMFTADFRLIAAGAIMVIIPILIGFLFAQRYFVDGLSGAVKG
ncbi:MAG TPA: carbohydrate ABC transporter permease [Chloroflexaceae bacterium]|nr:carbohydrate ABC transporter permease [Chloroflexaceae bacterium]